MSKFKKLNITIILTLIFSMIFSVCSFAKDCSSIRNEVLRLHILAASDSEEDQKLKLLVRDAVLKEGKDIFDNAKDVFTAQAKIEKEKDRLEQIAERVVAENGKDYDVSVVLAKEYFNTRTYDDVTLPAGRYNAVRIVIGSGEGHNWWCVMFPPMCLPAAESKADIDAVLDEDEVKIVKSNPDYEVRFKVVELYEKFKATVTGSKYYTR